MFENVKLTVIRSNRKSIAVKLKPGEIITKAPLWMEDEDINAFLESRRDRIEEYLRQLGERQKDADEIKPFTKQEIAELYEKAREFIPQRVEYYAKKMGVDYGDVTIRMQRTRWGSCSRSGNLSFNCILMLLPIEIIDSTIVHELCHRKHMNHSAAFYQEVYKAFPDYEKHDKWLRENGLLYVSRIPD